MNFIKEKNKEKVNGKVIKMLQNIIFMKENILMIKNMVKASILGQVVTFTKEILSKMKDKVMVKCCGLMEACMKVNGLKEYNMDKVELYFQMVLIKKDFLKIMFIKERKKMTTQNQILKVQKVQ